MDLREDRGIGNFHFRSVIPPDEIAPTGDVMDIVLYEVHGRNLLFGRIEVRGLEFT